MVKITQDVLFAMSNRRIVISTILAGGAFAIAANATIGENLITGMQPMLEHAGLAATHVGGISASHLPGLIALELSGAAFIVSWNQRSFAIAGLLIGAGILYAIHLGTLLGDHIV